MDIRETLPAFSSDVFVAEIDAAKARSLRSFYPRIAKALFFPDYFGHNLDALLDCLCSLDVLGKQEVVLLLRNAPMLLSKEKPEKKSAVLQVFRDAEKPENRYDGIKFSVIGIRH